MKIITATPWAADMTVGVSWDPGERDPTFQIHLGPAAVEIPVRWVPGDWSKNAHLGRWSRWNVYVGVDANMWMIGWHWFSDDRGLYLGPCNVQFETREPLRW